MSIDVHTLYLAVTIASGTSVMAILLVWLVNRRVPGVGFWLLGTLTKAMAWPLYLSQGSVDSRALVYFLPTVLVSVTLISVYCGGCRFTGRAVGWRLMGLLWVTMMVPYLYYLFIEDNMVKRLSHATVYAMVMFFLIAWVFLRERREGLRFSTGLMGGGFLMAGLAMIYRWWLWTGAEPPTDWVRGADGGSVSLAAGSIVLTFLWMFFLLMMVNQYQTREVAMRMESEHAMEQKLLEARAEMEQQRGEHLRQMMARELHDGIGGITATVAMLAGTGKEGEVAVAERAELLKLIEEMALEGNRNIRGLLGFLDSGVFRWKDLLFELEDYARKVLSAAGVALEWVVEGRVDGGVAPRAEVGQALKRVAMEALHNLIRHSGASRVRVGFVFREDGVVMEVRDDGCGFGGERQGGRGVMNMRARVEELGGRFQIERDEGTRVRVELPWGEVEAREASV